MSTVTTVDPATGRPLATYAHTGDHELSAALDRAVGTARSRRREPAADRAAWLRALELGGSDPFVVLADADVGAAARAAVRSRFLNNGQSCIAAKRLIVERPVRDAFVEAALAELGTLVVGDPAAPGTDIGPMARTDLRDELRHRLAAALRGGARLLCGGEADERPGAWFTPTLVEVREPAGPAFEEETFGPLGAVHAVASPAAAIQVANASRYGLGCSIWTGDLDRAGALAQQVEAGSVFINRISESDPRMPIGGIKASGHGRELGAHGALEFANLQAVRITPGASPTNSGETS